MTTEAVVFCDGSASPNPGVEGLGAVIVTSAGRVELYNGGGRGTNNTAELGAALLALEALPAQCRVVVYSDSQYLVYGMTKWVAGWRRKGFVRGGEPIPNADLWRRLDSLNSGRAISWGWVRGHNGNRGNELADKLATLGRRQ
ncbi:MAG: ribonuclease H [Hyphomicrobiaceae bacterium]|nr:ribonuclease H [Hyphomicrobiaceae bacterium]